MQLQPLRYAAYDGRLSDLESKSPASFIPIISDNWNKHFSWKGDGPMPNDQRAKLEAIIRQAHRKHQLVRFWATPDKASPQRTAVWKELLRAQVDLINTDDPPGLRDFLSENAQ